MACYVDDVRHVYGRMVMCHLWGDTLDELLAMVDTIGVQRKWIQGHETLSFGRHKRASWVHFDIALTKKAKALKAGAILTDRYGPLEFRAKTLLASSDPHMAAHGQALLDSVRKARSTPRLTPS